MRSAPRRVAAKARVAHPLRWMLAGAALALVVAAAAIVSARHAERTHRTAAHAARDMDRERASARSPPIRAPSADRSFRPMARASRSRCPIPLSTTRVVVRSVEPSQVVRIASGGDEQEMLPAWSPDGNRIAFERVREGGCTMFVASSLGGDEREVGPCRDATVIYFDWTPDGRGLITAQSRTGRGDLALVKLDPRERRSGVPQIRAQRRGSGSRAALFAGWTLHRVPPRRRAVQRSLRDAGRRRRRAAGYAHRFADSRPHVDARRPRARVRVELRRIDGALRGRHRFGRTSSRSASRRPNIPMPRAMPTRSLTRFRARRTSSPRSVSPMRMSQTLAPSTGSDYAAALSPDGERIAFVSDRGGRSRSSGSTIARRAARRR